MNICAVRTLEVSQAEHGNNLWVNAEKLSHEPKPAHRYTLNLVNFGLSPADETQLRCSMDNYAECKHCGVIYAESVGG